MRESPADIEMEKKLLSVLMLQGGKAIPEVAELVSAEDFYREEHKLIYRAILAVADTGVPLDALLVEGELRRTGDIVKVTPHYLLRLIDYEFSTVRAATYAKTIRDKAQLRRLIDMCAVLADKAYSDKYSAAELIPEFASMLMSTCADKEVGLESAREIAISTYERVQKISRIQGLTGVNTGFIELNNITNGLQKSELILLAARPAMGKTALALNIAQNAARRKKSVAVFSLEMSKAQLGMRLLSATSGVEAKKLNSGDLTDSETREVLNAVGFIGDLPLYVDDTAVLSVAGLRMKARRFKQEHGLDLIVVDYLQLMQSTVRDNRVQEISEISRGLKLLARELDVPVLALSQLNRGVEMRADKRPLLSDLRDSGSLEQGADIVMFLYRDEYYNREDETNANIAELIIAKNRNGATATIRMYFDKERTCFQDLLRED